jgi:NADP-dependent aldehyde dehydrogenase
MGSINPTFLMPEKLAENPEAMGKSFAGSVTLGVGQFCTNPGLLVGIKSTALDTFSQALAEGLTEVTGTMLNAKIAESYYQYRDSLLDELGVSHQGNTEKAEGNMARALTASVNASTFLTNPNLHEEIFGPFTLMVVCESASEMEQVAASLHGQLTGTLVATENDLTQNDTPVKNLQQKVGRILFNGVPTGVEACSARHHGGPYPASTNAKYPSVGTAAISRLTRPISYQHWPDSLLPVELQQNNPLGIWRLVNGERTKT